MNYWYMVVIFAGVFADGTQEAYVFQEPHYYSVNECVSAANDPDQIPHFAKKLVKEYGKMMDIQKVVCASHKEIIETFGSEYAIGDPA